LNKPLDGRRCGKGLKNFKMPLSVACPVPLSEISPLLLIGAELGPVNYQPHFLVAVDIIHAGVESTPAPIVTPLRRSVLNSSRTLLLILPAT
jgi:hypothetical protein